MLVQLNKVGKIVVVVGSEKINLTIKNHPHLNLIAAKSTIGLCRTYLQNKEQRLEFLNSKAKDRHTPKIKFLNEVVYIQEIQKVVSKHITKLEARPVNKLRIFHNYKR